MLNVSASRVFSTNLQEGIALKIETDALFPSPVWSILFDDRASLNAKLLELANKMRINDPDGVSNTNVKGWQSPSLLQNLDEFKDINQRILQICQRIGESQHFNPNVILDHQAWVNISPPGASNKIHYHANCHFSGVYYISLKAPECGSIFFRDPRVASRMFGSPLTKLNDFTTEEIRMLPEEGRMYIFPGWLEHGVDTNQSEEDRVSISFNVRAFQQVGSFRV